MGRILGNVRSMLRAQSDDPGIPFRSHRDGVVRSFQYKGHNVEMYRDGHWAVEPDGIRVFLAYTWESAKKVLDYLDSDPRRAPFVTVDHNRNSKAGIKYPQDMEYLP